MSMSIGATSNALSYLQSLLQQGAAGANGPANANDPLSALLQTLSGFGASTDPATSAAAPIGTTASSGYSSFDASTMAALISLQGQSATGVTAHSSSQLFAKLDTNGDGQISKSEFETALGDAGVNSSSADALFAKLDSNGDGSISQSELAKAKHGHHHHHHGGGEPQANASAGQNAIDTLLSSAGASGAATQTASNSNGSTTTTISYANGSTVEMTLPAAEANGSGTSSTGTSGQSSANLLEQLIQLQAQLLNSATPTLAAVA